MREKDIRKACARNARIPLPYLRAALAEVSRENRVAFGWLLFQYGWFIDILADAATPKDATPKERHKKFSEAVHLFEGVARACYVANMADRLLECLFECSLDDPAFWKRMKHQDDIRSALEYLRCPVTDSLDQPFGNEDERTLHDTLPDERSIPRTDEAAARDTFTSEGLERLLAQPGVAGKRRLKPLEHDVLRLLYSEDSPTDEAVAAELNIKLEKVRQYRINGLRKLRMTTPRNQHVFW